jgi:hypothetical protein
LGWVLPHLRGMREPPFGVVGDAFLLLTSPWRCVDKRSTSFYTAEKTRKKVPSLLTRYTRNKRGV